jgi:hypothetical protein
MAVESAPFSAASRSEKIAAPAAICVRVVSHGSDRGRGKRPAKLDCEEKRMEWRCAGGHKVINTLLRIEGGTWCHACDPYRRTEAACRRVVSELCGGALFPETAPAFLRGLRLDGYNADMGLAFEFQGEHHKQVSTGMIPGDDEGKLRDRQAADRRKAELCEKNGVGLIVVEWEQRGEMRSVVGTALQELGYKHL